MKLSISVRDRERCYGVVERPVDDSWLTAGNSCCAASLVNQRLMTWSKSKVQYRSNCKVIMSKNRDGDDIWYHRQQHYTILL